MTANEIIEQILGWELHKWSPTSSLAYMCQVKADLIHYVMENCSCTDQEKEAYQQNVNNLAFKYGALREYAAVHQEEFPMRHLSLLKQLNYKTMKHRYEGTAYWGDINMYLGQIRKVGRL